jgi:hypothetical protein
MFASEAHSCTQGAMSRAQWGTHWAAYSSGTDSGETLELTAWRSCSSVRELNSGVGDYDGRITKSQALECGAGGFLGPPSDFEVHDVEDDAAALAALRPGTSNSAVQAAGTRARGAKVSLPPRGMMLVYQYTATFA